MRTETILRRAAMVALVGGLVPACEQVKRVDGGSAACVPAEVQAAFDRSCSGGGCHSSAPFANSLSLAPGASGDAIGKQASTYPLPLIELGNTEGSYLAQKIMLNPSIAIVGDVMPPGFSASNATQVEDVNTILTWIGGGVFDCASADTGGSADTGMGSGSGDTGTALRGCGLEDLNPGAADPIVSGTDPMQIPPDIATILVENCGCHYTNEYPTPPPYIDYKEGTQPLDIATWAGFQATNPTGTPYHAVTLTRVMGGPPIAMPPGDPHCQAMSAEDTATLIDWLTAEAPDCTTWTGAGCTGEMTTQGCGLEDVKAGAPNPMNAGTGAMQIPPDIGTILTDNCGCHLADDLDVALADYSGMFDMSTLGGWQLLTGGTMPVPYHEVALDYLEMDFMPFEGCDVGGGVKMPTDDRDTLVAWLTAGAPDGATWMP
ncbi:MAG: hypothetical protein IPK74_37420 [Deltaproteobacteria bacterium]|nr:hypothetical protein [Deltaproteobacteria bacterium]